MAFTISTIYKAVDKFTPIVRKMEQANKKFADRQSLLFKNMGGAISNVRNQLIGLAGGVSIASLFAIGGSAVIKFDESLHSLSAITGVTGKQFEGFKKEILDVAARTKMAGYDVAKAFELVGSKQPELLKDAKALAKVSEAAIVLSKASKDDLATSTANVTGIMNQFSLGADQAKRTINALSAGNVVGSTSITLVAESMKNVGAVAATSNMSLEQTVSALEVLGKFQLEGAEAGTKLRGVISKLKTAGYGYASGLFNINDALVDARIKYDKLKTAKEKDSFITKVFMEENKTAGLIMLNNIPLFEQFTKGVTGTNSAYEMAAINSASFSVKLKELRARFENLIIKGNENSKALNRFGKAVTYVTDNLDRILAVVGYTVVAFGAYYTAMTLFNVVTKLAAAATWLFNSALLANPITWIVIAIIAAIAAVTILVVKWKEITKWFKESSLAIKLLLSPLIVANAALIAIAFIIRKSIDLWKQFSGVFKDGGFVAGIKAIGKALLSFLLKPVEWILKTVAKITGAKWAGDLLNSMQTFRGGLEEGMEKEKPVNTEKIKTERYEEVVKQKLEIELNNKSDKRAAMKFNPAYAPIVGGTFG